MRFINLKLNGTPKIFGTALKTYEQLLELAEKDPKRSYKVTCTDGKKVTTLKAGDKITVTEGMNIDIR